MNGGVIERKREERSPRKRQRTQCVRRDGSHDAEESAFAALLDAGNDEGESIRSSWFHDIEEFATDTSLLSTPRPQPEDDELRRIESEIKGLSKQLSSVKQRLGPASEDCARAVNDHGGQQNVSWSRRGGDRRSTTSPSHEFVQARALCNPYEALGQRSNGGLNSMFMNRSAIKLANLDALLHFHLTSTAPRPGAGEDTSDFRFVDLCGAPGGFSEYLIRRCVSNQRSCHGYGMSLHGRNDQGQGLPWRLPETSYGEAGGFQFQVSYGLDGTGDICNWENVQFLKSTIERDCHEACHTTPDCAGRVDLVVCDGGVDAQRDSDYQEEITQKLVVCQASAALELVRPGGTVVLKMFGFQTAVIQAMLQDMAFFFDKIVSLKPISSRPASAERYFVFSGFQRSQAWTGGLPWQSRVFRGDCTQSPLPVEAAKRLRLYLNRFDRDMLRLNLESCFAILSHLERKLLSHSQSNGESPVAVALDNEELEPHRIHVAAYRQAWQIDF